MARCKGGGQHGRVLARRARVEEVLALDELVVCNVPRPPAPPFQAHRRTVPTRHCVLSILERLVIERRRSEWDGRRGSGIIGLHALWNRRAHLHKCFGCKICTRSALLAEARALRADPLQRSCRMHCTPRLQRSVACAARPSRLARRRAGRLLPRRKRTRQRGLGRCEYPGLECACDLREVLLHWVPDQEHGREADERQRDAHDAQHAAARMPGRPGRARREHGCSKCWLMLLAVAGPCRVGSADDRRPSSRGHRMPVR